MSLRYLSVCSGIEAASVAWHPLGWAPIAFAEIERFPSEVLAHHFGSNLPGDPWSGNAPPNYGDMTKFKEWPDHAIDVLVGGTPCQSFSVAGLRKGLADPRGNLALVYLAIADRYRPEWICWENVPGVLSSEGGRDFGAFLGALGQLGYGFAYRVLDAQYVRVDGFGRAVPQRRRRVFVVGHSDWRRAAAVLFDGASLRGDSAPSRKAGEGIAVSPTIRAGGNRTGGDRPPGTDVDTADSLIAFPERMSGTQYASTESPSPALCSVNPTAIAFAQNSRDEVRMFGGDGGVVGALAAEPGMKQTSYVALPYTLAVRGRTDGHNLEYRQDGTANAILTPNGGRAGIGVGAIASGWAVRRLMPTECERLQGFPDGWTAIDRKGKPAADGPRYKALGNSMAVPVMRWIGRRLDAAHSIARAA